MPTHPALMNSSTKATKKAAVHNSNDTSSDDSDIIGWSKHSKINRRTKVGKKKSSSLSSSSAVSSSMGGNRSSSSTKTKSESESFMSSSLSRSSSTKAKSNSATLSSSSYGFMEGESSTRRKSSTGGNGDRPIERSFPYMMKGPPPKLNLIDIIDNKIQSSFGNESTIDENSTVLSMSVETSSVVDTVGDHHHRSALFPLPGNVRVRGEGGWESSSLASERHHHLQETEEEERSNDSVQRNDKHNSSNHNNLSTEEYREQKKNKKYANHSSVVNFARPIKNDGDDDDDDDKEDSDFLPVPLPAAFLPIPLPRSNLFGDDNVSAPTPSSPENVAPSLMGSDTSTAVYRTPLAKALVSKYADPEMRSRMIATVKAFRSIPPTPVQPDVKLAARVQEISRSRLKTKKTLIAMNLGAIYLLLITNGYVDVDSWFLPIACDAVEDEEDLDQDLNSLLITKNMVFHHGITQDDDEDEKYLAMTMCLQALNSLATSDGTRGARPTASFDCVQGHCRTGNKSHDKSAGSVKIDKDKTSAKLLVIHALAHNRSAHFNGAVAMTVLKAVILEEDRFIVVDLSDADIAQELCPNYKPMRQKNGMDNYNAIIVYDRETTNTCFVTTSEQLASILYGGFTSDCSRNMLIIPIHSFNYMRFYIFGASFADKVYGRIEFYHQSPLYKLATKDGIKDIEAALKNNDIIPEDVKLRTSKSKGAEIGGRNSNMYMTTGTAKNGRTKAEITDDKSRGGKGGGTATLGVPRKGKVESKILVLYHKNENKIYYSVTDPPMLKKMVELQMFNTEKGARNKIPKLKEYGEEVGLGKPFHLKPCYNGKPRKDFMPYGGACGSCMPTDLDVWMSVGKVPQGDATELK